MFKYIFIIFFLFYSFLGFSFHDPDPLMVEQLQSFQKTQGRNATCINKNPNKTLLLIDKTDKLSPAQIAFIKASYVDNYNWTEFGDTFGIAALNNSGVSLMKTETICAPKPLNVNNGLQNRNRVKNFNNTLHYIFNELIEDEPKANKTNLFEAIVEVYRNPTFKFSPTSQGRTLIIISDLYQNSTNINFYKRCKEGCLSFESSLESDPSMKKYLDLANLKLSDKDKIKIYHLQSRCKIAESIDKWWVGAFTNAGLLSDNIVISHELAGDCPSE